MYNIKTCKYCNETKELSEFYSMNKTRKDGTPVTYYHPECKQCAIKLAIQWQKDNPEKRKIHEKKQNKSPKKRQQIKELSKKARDSGVYYEWLKNNNKSKEYVEKRMQHKKHNISKKEWEACKAYFDYKCAYCRLSEKEHKQKYKQGLHKEHVQHDGSNDITNCVPSCKVCNSSKHTSTLTEWYNKNNPVFTQYRLNKINKWLEYDVHNI